MTLGTSSTYGIYKESTTGDDHEAIDGTLTMTVEEIRRVEMCHF
jgi:hypothetical protein